MDGGLARWPYESGEKMKKDDVARLMQLLDDVQQRLAAAGALERTAFVLFLWPVDTDNRYSAGDAAIGTNIGESDGSNAQREVEALMASWLVAQHGGGVLDWGVIGAMVRDAVGGEKS